MPAVGVNASKIHLRTRREDESRDDVVERALRNGLEERKGWGCERRRDSCLFNPDERVSSPE